MRFLSALAIAAIAFAAAAKDKTVVVNCAQGQSLNSALTDPADPLVIEFTGVCAEDVVIARDNVTLRGVAPDAKITGAPAAPVAAPALSVRAASNITLKDFAVQDSDRRGIAVHGSHGVTIDGIVSDGNVSDGLFITDGSAVFIRNSSFDDNGGDGIGMWQNSGLMFEGAITMNDNNRVGLLISGSSNASMSFFGGSVSANGNPRCGYFLQLGAAAQLAAANPTTVTASGNTDCGVGLFGESSWAGPVTVQNSSVGVDVTTSMFDSTLNASGCNIGLFAHLHSYVALRNSAVSGNTFGLRLDSATSQINNSNMTGNTNTDLRLQFGTHASFGGTNTAGTVSCDDTVLVRGGVTCPAPPPALLGIRAVAAEPSWTATVLEMKP